MHSRMVTCARLDVAHHHSDTSLLAVGLATRSPVTTGESASGYPINKFTKLVWDETTHVGCGYTRECQNMFESAHLFNNVMYCIFSPPGNNGDAAEHVHPLITSGACPTRGHAARRSHQAGAHKSRRARDAQAARLDKVQRGPIAADENVSKQQADEVGACHDDPTYHDVWDCHAWAAVPEGCRTGYSPVDTPERIAALVHACPVSCPDVTPICEPSPAPTPPVPSPPPRTPTSPSRPPPPDSPPAPHPPTTGSGSIVLPMINDARAEHCNTPPLQWDRELAAAAQEYAETCPSGHDDTLPHYLGETVAFNAHPYAYLVESEQRWSEVISSWHDEQVKSFNFTTGTSTAKMSDFTQLVWNETTHVGCGYYRECHNVYASSGMYNNVAICRFSPRGNTPDGFIAHVAPLVASGACPAQQRRSKQQRRSRHTRGRRFEAALQPDEPIV